MSMKPDPKGWRAEFYSKPVDRFPNIGPGGDGRWPTIAQVREAVAHSLRKWQGYRPQNLAKYGFTSATKPVSCSSGTCLLCRYFDRTTVLGGLGCTGCPLYLARGKFRCDQNRPAESASPYLQMTRYGDPLPMIFWLEKAEEFVEKVASGKIKPK